MLPVQLPATGSPHRALHAPLSRELKFVFSAKNAERVCVVLDRMLRPDPEYPAATVTSVYFDTADWSHLDEKRDSDYLKSKYRLRWYRVAGSDADAGPAFAEVKHRTGSTRRKERWPAPIAIPWLENTALEDPAWLAFTHFLRRQSVTVRGALFPAFVIRYHRRRYVDPATGARVCVDTDIEVPRVNRLMVPVIVPVRLETAVFEVKGRLEALPAAVPVLCRLGAQRGSFSKYGSCFRKLVGSDGYL